MEHHANTYLNTKDYNVPNKDLYTKNCELYNSCPYIDSVIKVLMQLKPLSLSEIYQMIADLEVIRAINDNLRNDKIWDVDIEGLRKTQEDYDTANSNFSYNDKRDLNDKIWELIIQNEELTKKCN